MILTVTLNAAIDKRYVVEEARPGEVNRVKECEYTPGGKGLNVSKPAAIYGAEVTATGFVGGHAGHYIEDALKPFHIKSAFYHMEAESRSCINIWDEKISSRQNFWNLVLQFQKKISRDSWNYSRGLCQMRMW